MALSKIKTNSIADNAITSTKIGVDVIVAEDLASNSITVAEIASGAVTPAKLSTGGLYWDTSSNVGIGTTSPNADGKLDVIGGRIRQQATGASAGMLFGQYDSSANAHVTNQANAPLWFGTNNTERVRITSAGFVGIGTTSPAAQLSVTGADAAGSSGTVYFTQNAATNYPTLQIRQLGAGGNTGDIQGLRVEVDGTGAGYSMAVNRYGSNYTMLLRNDGPFMVGNSRFSPVGTSNSIPVSTYYNEEKLYQLSTSSGSFDICTITSAYTYGCLIIECGGTIQYAAADQRSASNRKVAVTFAVGSITVANLYTPYVGSFGTINFTYVSNGVLKINVTGATTGVGQGNGIAWVKVIGGQASVNSTSTPLGFTLS